MKIVIIEDEQIAAKELINSIHLVRNNYQIVEVLSSVSESIEFLNHAQKEFDLIISDIQLGDGLCFDIFFDIELNKPIIFCTAYNEYMMQAFKSNGIDYILKPYSIESIEKAISKYEKLFGTKEKSIQEQNNAIFNLSKELNAEAILLYHKDRIIPININEIALFTLKNNFLRMYYVDGKSFIIDYSLDEIERIIDDNFFRANRQNIISKKSIKNIEKLLNRKIKVNLLATIAEEIIISKEKATSFQNWIKTI